MLIMKRVSDSFLKVFQYIYLVLSLIYIVGIPFIVVYMSSVNKYNFLKISRLTTFYSLVLCLVTFVVFLFELTLNKKRREMVFERKVILIFLLFFVWCGLSTFFSSNVHDSFFGVPFRYGGFLQYLSYISFAILGFSLNEKTRKIYFRVLFFASIIIGIMTLFNGKVSWYKLPTNEICGIFYNINHYGYYLVYTIVVSIFLFLYDKNIIVKVIDFFGYILLLYILIINNTFGCYIAVLLTIIILFLYFIKNRENELLMTFLLVPLIFLSVIVRYNDDYVVASNFKELFNDVSVIFDSDNEKLPIDDFDNKINYIGNFRGGLWVRGIKYVFEKPLFGYGLENVSNRYLKDHIDIDMPHNLILQLSMTVGIIGMLLYIAGVLIVLIVGLRNTKKDDILSLLGYFVLIAHLISAMFGVTIYYVTPYFVIILGACIRNMKENWCCYEY